MISMIYPYGPEGNMASYENKPLRQIQGGVRLWRIWRHKGGLLYALVRDQYWEKNPEGATRCDETPHMGSSSGFYGFYDLAELKAQEGSRVAMARTGARTGHYEHVIGSFIAYGKMVKGSLGCRAEYAKPEYLILPDQNEDFSIELMTVAGEYGMKPIVASQARELKTGLVRYVKPRIKPKIEGE